MESRFGHPDDWGLSPQRHSEIASELSDHLDCLQADEGQEAAHEAEQRLAEPQTRRRLTAAHIADQVVATLHRRPNREEWRELGWLVFWFAVVLLGDWIVGYCGKMTISSYSLFSDQTVPHGIELLSVSGWLLLGIGRTFFFVVLAKGVHDAWKRGWGVLIARLLQYKLIHTLMVVIGLLLIGPYMAQHFGLGMLGWADQLPANMTATLGLAFVTVLLFVLAVPRFRKTPAWAFCLLMLAFTYTTGPAKARFVEYERPFPSTKVSEDANFRYYGHETDPEKIRERMESYVGSIGRLPEGWSMEHRFITWQDFELAGPYLNSTVSMLSDFQGNPGQRKVKPIKWLDQTESHGPWRATTPGSYSGSGLGWIAAPVPLMGILGLLAMLFIMGRRGLLPAVLYSLLTLIALYCSVIPFVMTQKIGNIVDFSLEAFSKGPLPGFEQILVVNELQSGMMIMGALLLSAGIPWLLTGLFLRGEQGKPAPADDDGIIEVGG